MTTIKTEEYSIFDTLPGALLEVAFSSRMVIYMNRIAYAIFGYSEKDIEEGLEIENIFLTQEEFGKALQIAESFGLADYQASTPYTRLQAQDLYDFMLRKKDGTGFYGECQGSFVLNDEKVPVGIRLHIRDLTKQRLMEVSLQESEQKYRTLVEYSSDLIFLINEKGVVLSVNQAAVRSLGKMVVEVQGKNLFELFPPNVAEGYRLNVDNVFLTGESGHHESTIPGANGKIWLSTSINPVKDDMGKVTAVLGVSRDIGKSGNIRTPIPESFGQHSDFLRTVIPESFGHFQRVDRNNI